MRKLWKFNRAIIKEAREYDVITSPSSYTIEQGTNICMQTPRLSEGEQRVMLLIVEGKNNSEIAGELFLSQNTIKTHRKSILRKYNAKNIAQATHIWTLETL